MGGVDGRGDVSQHLGAVAENSEGGNIWAKGRAEAKGRGSGAGLIL